MLYFLEGVMVFTMHNTLKKFKVLKTKLSSLLRPMLFTIKLDGKISN